MLEILQYATSGFWTFMGCALLFALPTQAAVALLVAIMKVLRHD